MNKTKNSFEKIGKYLREISVVVIGVAITLSASYWISNVNDKKNMKLYLKTIKMELEMNTKNFDSYAEWLQKSVKYAEYLKSNDNRNLNKDSLQYYAFTNNKGCGYMNTNSLTTQFFTKNAFEMFKSSNFMSKLTDKELLISILNAYTYLEYAKEQIDRSFQIKENEAIKELELIANGKLVDTPMRVYYNTDILYSLVRTCENASEIIKDTILKIEKSKIINR